MNLQHRLLIVEEALKNRKGFWYEYNKAIVKEACSRGIDVTLLAHKAIENDIQKELNARSFFPKISFAQFYNHPNAFFRYFSIICNNILVFQLIRHHLKVNPAYDIILVPTVTLYHWIAWRWLVLLGGGRWFQKVVLTIRNNAGEYNPEYRSYKFNTSARILAKIVRSFRRPVELKIVELASDSNRLADQHTKLTGLPFRTYPHPRPTNHLAVLRPEVGCKKQLVFSALGSPRYEKGSDLIVQAISILLKTEPKLPIKFTIQWNDRVFKPDGEEVFLSEELKHSEKVEVICRNLSSAEYQNRIDASDLMLLPYRRVQYYARVSGIAIEAFQSGIPCICIADTWLEECMNNIGAGYAIEKETAEALSSGILKVVKNYKTIRKYDLSKIIMARRMHSPEAFLDKLFS